MKRTIVIVDDIPDLADNLNRAIANYYNEKKMFDYHVIPFSAPTHFSDAKNYINSHCAELNVLFSDQHLKAGTGIQLFQEATKKFISHYQSVGLESDVFKILHSDEEHRHKEFQMDQRYGTYDFFVNSDEETDVIKALDFYENQILQIKNKGNPTFLQFAYDNPTIQSQQNKVVINLENKAILLKDIYFLVMDRDDIKGEHYFIYYDDGQEIIKSKESKKIVFHDKLRLNHFINGKLKNDHQEKFKINPLRVASINQNTSCIILLSPHSVKFKIGYKSLDTYPEQVIFQNLEDPFFSK